ncbi:uncharacterized protein LOC125306524 [Alosa alosa]|uniref:uncharacterized protein LOC125306524 n=1 Tax=Alosa alosa TaxID=278164 RepID=UPI0020154AF3|nr:uncharacterized protein LOC125306524 [Alosa alosa]
MAWYPVAITPLVHQNQPTGHTHTTTSVGSNSESGLLTTISGVDPTAQAPRPLAEELAKDPEHRIQPETMSCPPSSPNMSPTVSTADDPSLPGPHRYRCAVVVLGLLTALLLSALVASLVYYHGYVSNTIDNRYITLMIHNANLSNFNKIVQARYDNASAANQHLHSEMVLLQEEKKTLTMERDHLNRTLEFIFHFSVFPVDDYCPVTDNSTQGLHQ